MYSTGSELIIKIDYIWVPKWVLSEKKIYVFPELLILVRIPIKVLWLSAMKILLKNKTIKPEYLEFWGIWQATYLTRIQKVLGTR